MAAETKAKKRGFRAPHALVIMVILVCITALLTYVVPAGEFDRTEDPVTGNTIVVADSYHRVEQTPVSLLRVPGIMYQSMVDAADIVIFLLMIGGAFEIIHSTGAITALSCKVAQICGHHFLYGALRHLWYHYGHVHRGVHLCPNRYFRRTPNGL